MKVSGVTVHLVDCRLDAGPIVVQRPVPVCEGDTVEALADRILAVEHQAYPEAIRLLLDRRWRIRGPPLRARTGVIAIMKMSAIISSVALLALFGAVAAGTRPQPGKPMLQYPDARKVDQVDDFFGTKVADPYRWLENSDAPDTRAWIDAENRGHLRLPVEDPRAGADQGAADRDLELRALRHAVAARAPGTSSPQNSGLQPQAVVYKARDARRRARRADRPEHALEGRHGRARQACRSREDGRYMAYSLAASGSDWIEWHVRDVATSQDLPDLVKWSKFSGASWLKDGSGFYYSRYDEPKGEALQALNKNQKVFFHKLGHDAGRETRWSTSGPTSPTGASAPTSPRTAASCSSRRPRAPTTGTACSCATCRSPDGTIEPFLDALRRHLLTSSATTATRSTC